MTNEEAIEMLKAKLECITRDVSGRDDDCNRRLCGECRLNYEKGTMGEQKEYLRMAIEALEQQPCEDCINKADVKEQMIKYGFTAPDMTVTEFAEECLPSVTSQPKIGKWVRVTDKTGHLVWECNRCGWQQRFTTNYCPDCGAKMQGVAISNQEYKTEFGLE